MAANGYAIVRRPFGASFRTQASQGPTMLKTSTEKNHTTSTIATITNYYCTSVVKAKEYFPMKPVSKLMSS